MSIEIGNIVRIVNTGSLYSSYDFMAEELGATKWKSEYRNNSLNLDDVGTVINILKRDGTTYVLVLIPRKDQEFVIGIKGIEFLSTGSFYTAKKNHNYIFPR